MLKKRRPSMCDATPSKLTYPCQSGRVMGVNTATRPPDKARLVVDALPLMVQYAPSRLPHGGTVRSSA